MKRNLGILFLTSILVCISSAQEAQPYDWARLMFDLYTFGTKAPQGIFLEDINPSYDGDTHTANYMAMEGVQSVPNGEKDGIRISAVSENRTKNKDVWTVEQWTIIITPQGDYLSANIASFKVINNVLSDYQLTGAKDELGRKKWDEIKAKWLTGQRTPRLKIGKIDEI